MSFLTRLHPPRVPSATGQPRPFRPEEGLGRDRPEEAGAQDREVVVETLTALKDTRDETLNRAAQGGKVLA